MTGCVCYSPSVLQVLARYRFGGKPGRWYGGKTGRRYGGKPEDVGLGKCSFGSFMCF